MESHICDLLQIPYELIHMIYDHLDMTRDVVSLSLTCKWIYNNMSDEHKRILNIRKGYIPINNAISDIKYYIARYSLDLFSRSIRIDRKLIMYVSKESFDNDEHRRRMQGFGFGIGKKLIGELYSQDINYDKIMYSFREQRHEIYETLAERKIVVDNNFNLNGWVIR